MTTWKSAAAQRLLRSTGSSSVPLAVGTLAESLLQGANTPPTDLDLIAKRLNATVIQGDIFGSGELRRAAGGFEIVYAKDLAPSRRRFTIAHEIAHIAIIQTGPRAPTAGREVERLCDLIAVELLMPRSVFEAYTPEQPRVGDIFALAKQFQTSLVATAQRCTEIRRLTVLEVAKGKITRCVGTLRYSSVLRDPMLLDHLRSACEGHSGESALYLNDDNSIIPVRVECHSLGRSGRALCLLTRMSAAAARDRLARGTDVEVVG
jgi:hypothetical protein